MRDILSVKVVADTYEEVTAKCVEWAKRGESRAIIFANVHVLM